MKKLLLIAVSIAGLCWVHAQDAGTNQPPALPSVDVTSITNVVHVVQPVTLTAAQLDGIIQAIQAIGITSNVQLGSTNISTVTITRNWDGSYTATVTLQPGT